MSFLWNLFQKKTDEDYETVLSVLALDIQKRQQKLSEIRLRERRATLVVTLYTLAAWVAYVSVWYSGVFDLRRWTARGRMERAMIGAPVVIGPIVILFVRRIVQIWFTRKGDAEEKTLRDLLKQQRTKVEEIKKKTNYYSTRELLSRYDEGSPASTPPRGAGPRPSGVGSRMSIPAGGTPGQQPNTPKRPTPVSINGEPFLTTPPQPPRKQWFDKLADAVLGDDGQASQDKAQYALICESCYAHNGLVKESAWDTTQYRCPKCNHLNLSKKARASLGLSLSPDPQPASARMSLASPLSSMPMPSPSPPAGGNHDGEGQESMEVDSDSD